MINLLLFSKVMIFVDFAKLQIIFIVIASIVGAVVLFLLLFIPLQKLYRKRKYKNYYYRVIYKTALYRDYYLINNYSFKKDHGAQEKLDHLIFGEKFIYVIMDKYYDGDLTGSANDPSLILISKKGQRTYVDNPYYVFNKLLLKFSTETGINTDLLIGVTVVNDNCRMKIDSNSKQFFMVSIKKLKRLIKIVESREIGDINAKKLQDAVLTVHNINRQNTKNNK